MPPTSQIGPHPNGRLSRGLLITGGLVFLALTGCGGDENTFKAPPPPKVTAVNPPEHTFAPYRDVVATVRSRESVDVRARVDGFLETRDFEPGDLVTEGQTLFTLETDEYEAVVAGATADLRAAQARLQLDREVAGKYQQAFDRGAASEVELLEAKAKVEVSAASVDQAEAKLRRANLDLSYTTIKSPIEGRIGEDLVSIGNLVGRGEPTLLAKIRTVDPMNVYFDVPETAFLQFRRDLVEAGMSPDDKADYPFQLVLADDQVYGEQGRLDFADFEIDRSTGTLSMRGVIANPERFLRDGMFVRVRLHQPPRTALALPESAVLVDMAGSYVYIVGDQSLVVRQGVETGVSLGGLTEIVAGLAADDTVIVDGILRSRPGAAVDAELVTLPEAMKRLDPAAAIAGTDD